MSIAGWETIPRFTGPPPVPPFPIAPPSKILVLYPIPNIRASWTPFIPRFYFAIRKDKGIKWIIENGAEGAHKGNYRKNANPQID